MAELAGDYGYDAPPARSWTRLAVRALGACAALALIWGLAHWAQGLTSRSPGEIPFLKAEDGPFKAAPADPGGLTLDGAGRAVTRIVTGEGGTGARLAPDPEMPADEDLPQPLLTGVQSATVAAAPAPAPAAAPEAPTAAPAPSGGSNAIDDAVARALAQVEGAAGGGAKVASVASDEGASLDRSPGPMIEPGEHAPSVSPVFRARPEARVIQAAATTTAAVVATNAAAGDAAATPLSEAPAIASGDVVIQLGAFNSTDVADSQWRSHLRRNEDLLGGMTHHVTTVESGGRTLYRLRVGPIASRARAQELCAALKARSDACIVPRTGG